MAAFVGSTVTLAGTTYQTVIAAPAGGKQRQVLSCYANNLDSATRVFKSRKNKAGVFFDFADVTVASGQKAQLVSNSLVLIATDESYEVATDATAATTEPKVDPAAFEVP